MSGDRLFTEVEIRELEKHTLQVLQEAIESGDRERALRAATRMYREFQAMHDLYRDWLTAMFTYIGTRYGDAGLAEAMEETMGSFWGDVTDLYPEDVKRMVKMLASGLKGHLQPLHIEEDDEKITVQMTPCGSGGRLAQSGYYGPPRNYMRVKDPQPMTFGNANFPVYCVHNFFQNALPLWAGKRIPFVTYESSDPAREPCRMVIFKDPDHPVPEDVRQAVEQHRARYRK